jgi:hypothetical protein
MLSDTQFEFSYDAAIEQNRLKVRTLSIREFMMPTKRFLSVVIGLICLVPSMPAQPIPKELWGRWIVRRDLPTHMISCWGDGEARKLLGTEIEYSGELFRWKDIVTKNPTAVTTIITALQFHNEYSGQGAGSSDVTFKEIGINAGQAKRITIRHPNAHVSGATVEVPGDDVLVKDQSTIFFSVCSVFFEAKRATNPPSNPAH